MIRGTTPTFEFTLPFPVSTLKNAFVTFSQKRKVIINKELHQCECNENTLIVNLTQEDTLKFCCEDLVLIQVRVLTENNEALASQIIQTEANNILYDEVIT